MSKNLIVLSCIASVLILGLLFSLTGLTTVDKGSVGVVSFYQKVEDKPLEPGLYWMNPLKSITELNIQTQKDEEDASVPTKQGLIVSMKAVLLYHLKADSAVEMLKEVGADYKDRVITPYFKNAVRDVAGEYDAEAFYSEKRTAIEAKVFTRISKELNARGIEVEAVMLLDPVLPKVVKDRIEAKVGAEQDAARMEFVVRQKELEAKAKVVEAKGIAEAQNIIKKDLDEQYLKYLWIKALENHPGATIYIPTGVDGMPIFKRVEDSKK